MFYLLQVCKHLDLYIEILDEKKLQLFLEISFIFFRRTFDLNPSVPNFFDKLIFEKLFGTEILK